MFKHQTCIDSLVTQKKKELIGAPMLAHMRQDYLEEPNVVHLGNRTDDMMGLS